VGLGVLPEVDAGGGGDAQPDERAPGQSL